MNYEYKIKYININVILSLKLYFVLFYYPFKYMQFQANQILIYLPN